MASGETATELLPSKRWLRFVALNASNIQTTLPADHFVRLTAGGPNIIRAQARGLRMEEGNPTFLAALNNAPHAH